MARYAFPAARTASDPDWCRSPLENDYPHILETIQTMWGYRELNLYFRKLTIDERGGRAGFSPEVWADIHTLQSLHQHIVPESPFK